MQFGGQMWMPACHASIVGIWSPITHPWHQESGAGSQGFLLMKESWIRKNQPIKSHALSLPITYRTEFAKPGSRIVFKIQESIMSRRLTFYWLRLCIWLSTNLQRITHSTNPVEPFSNLHEPGIFGREVGTGDLKPTPLGQCMLGGEMSYRADNFQHHWFYFLYQAHENTLTKQRTQN